MIRGALYTDEGVLAYLDLRSWDPEFSLAPCPAAGGPFFDEAHTPEQYLVAERDSLIVGCVQLVQPVPLPSGDHVRMIQGLVVDPGERGQGTGRALVDAACAEALRQGARRITLRVLAGNAPARRLYERAGFVVEGVLPEEFFLNGRYVDDILMGRRLA